MKQEIKTILILCITIMLMILSATGIAARGQEVPFPQYGRGPIKVLIYSDYFCPPCRAMEPSVEPIVNDLLKRKAITLVMIDVPFHSMTPLYAKYFLYALKAKNDADHALLVRKVLMAATSDKQMTTEARIEDLFKSKGISYKAFETRPVFDRYNAMIKEDKVQATPTCVIVKNGKRESFTGGSNIVAALKRLL